MIIGLTGGIATGKSESAKYLKKLGAYIVDADEISHKLTQKGKPALKEVVNCFGKSILNKNEVLNRRKLAEIVFTNLDAKLRLEHILHKYIISYINGVVASKCHKYNVVINAPLLFEVGLDRICDKIIVIWAPYDIQAKRLAKRDKLNKEQVEKRISSQMPIETKIQLADFVIENTGTKTQLCSAIQKLYLKIANCPC